MPRSTEFAAVKLLLSCTAEKDKLPISLSLPSNSTSEGEFIRVGTLPEGGFAESLSRQEAEASVAGKTRKLKPGICQPRTAGIAHRTWNDIFRCPAWRLEIYRLDGLNEIAVAVSSRGPVSLTQGVPRCRALCSISFAYQSLGHLRLSWDSSCSISPEFLHVSMLEFQCSSATRVVSRSATWAYG